MPNAEGRGIGEPLSIDPVAPPLPGLPVIRQSWSDVAFLHWRADPALVAPLLPPGVRPDEFDGSSWVGLIAFLLSGHRFLPLPPVPVLGTFVEVNVRLYSVDALGNRAVVFRSLDAGHLLPVLAANASFGLPYRWARTAMRRDGDRREYAVRRHDARRTRSRFAVRTTGEPDDSALTRFLTARWGLHEAMWGRTWLARNAHGPWRAERAVLERLDDGVVAAAGLPGVADAPPDSVLLAPMTQRVDFSLARAVPR